MPEANTLTLGIFATLAQHERELIRDRTIEALAAKKAQEYKLGKPENRTYEHRLKEVEVRKQKAENNKANRQAKELIT